MFKGHARIELKNEKTGELLVREEENMFTDAIYRTLNNTWTALVGGVSTLKAWNLPLSQKLLGGVALFEDPIEEVQTNNYFPKENKVIGVAGTLASNGAKKWWGGRNALESVPYDSETKSVKHVWDFSTSEGNGTISAIGLMDGRQADYYGDSAWNLQYSRRLDVTSYFSAYGRRIAEFKGNDFVAMTNGKGNVTIKKIRFNFDTVSLNNNLGTTDVILERSIPLPMTNQYYTCCYWKDGDDGYWYGFICTDAAFAQPVCNYEYGDYQCSKYLQVIRIHKETFTMEYHNMTLPYCTAPRQSNPIITKNYIGFICTTASDWYWRSSAGVPNSLLKDKICLISKLDWTCVMKDLADENANKYSLYFATYNQCVSSVGLFNQMQNLKLPNGTYQMNELMFDDDFVVIRCLPGPIDSTTGLPDLNPASSSDRYTNLRGLVLRLPTDANQDYNTSWFMILNQEKSIFLVGECYSETWKVFVLPCDCQKLMTINNLAEPVTKTSTQTMKITYTISDLD